MTELLTNTEMRILEFLKINQKATIDTIKAEINISTVPEAKKLVNDLRIKKFLGTIVENKIRYFFINTSQPEIQKPADTQNNAPRTDTEETQTPANIECLDEQQEPKFMTPAITNAPPTNNSQLPPPAKTDLSIEKVLPQELIKKKDPRTSVQDEMVKILKELNEPAELPWLTRKINSGKTTLLEYTYSDIENAAAFLKEKGIADTIRKKDGIKIIWLTENKKVKPDEISQKRTDETPYDIVYKILKEDGKAISMKNLRDKGKEKGIEKDSVDAIFNNMKRNGIAEKVFKNIDPEYDMVALKK